MKGYKAFDKDLICRGVQYEIGKTYEMEGKLIICKKGFHFCKTIGDTYKFYPMDGNTRICEIEALGAIATENGTKFCTNKIKIVKEVTDSTLRKGNTGASNSGYCNFGHYNSGNRNSGDYNSGSYNSGQCNSGKYNSGYCNTGSWNSGHNNSGDLNSGDYNSGDFNSGYCNSGRYNSGRYNSGDYNSGDWNISSYNSGCFCTEDSKIKMFDKDSDWTYGDWCTSDAHAVLFSCPQVETVTDWINELEMNEEEKKNNPSYLITGGYLKVTEENGNRQEWWDNLSEEDKNVVMSLPNFDADKFYICTGIKVMDEDDSKNK